MSEVSNKGQPAYFSGTGTPSFWLKTMEPIKRVMTLNDDEITLISITHLRGKASHWWELTEPKVSTWKDFVAEFTKEYIQGTDNLDFHLDKFENYKRRKDQSIDELVSTLGNLCDKVNIKDDRYKIRKFIRAVEPNLAMELVKNGPFTSITAAATEAKRLEHVLTKYGTTVATSSPPSVLSRAESIVSDIMLDLIKRLEALQVNTLAVASQQAKWRGLKSVYLFWKFGQGWKMQLTWIRVRNRFSVLLGTEPNRMDRLRTLGRRL
ncbi:unnamed protein product [Absidia cylindrospora]